MAAKRTRAPYTDAERKRALELYLEHGAAEAGRMCAIPAATIRQWAHRAGLAGGTV